MLEPERTIMAPKTEDLSDDCDTSSSSSSSSSSSTITGSISSITGENSLSRRSQSFDYRNSSAHLLCKNKSTPKPHKANQSLWEAMNLLRLRSRGIGLDDFRLLGRLGNGDIGHVFLCQLRNHLTESLFAMKVVDMKALEMRNKLQRAEMEKKILDLIDHPFLPTLYAHFDVSHYSCLVMEFCPGGDLHALRQKQPGKKFNIASIKFYAAEILLALEYLHMMGIIYRDLKPENVLVREDGHIMLSDFDLSFKCDVIPTMIRPKLSHQIFENSPKIAVAASCTFSGSIQPVLSCFSKKKEIETNSANKKGDAEGKDRGPFDHEFVAEPINARSKSFVGTHEYVAPEVISGAGHGNAVDWWAFGILLFELLHGTTPFKGENNEQTLMNILKRPLRIPKINNTNAEHVQEIMKIHDLITKLLVKNPKKRMGTLKGSVEIKKHEFFAGVNWALIRCVKPQEIPSEYPRIKMEAKAPKMVKKVSRDDLYQIPQHFDYF